MDGAGAWVRRGGAVLAVALVIAAAVTVLVALRTGFGEEKKQTREFDAGATLLSLDVSAGDVDVRTGSGDRVKLTRTVRGSPEISERLDGDTVRIRSSCASLILGRCDVDYEIVVPRDVRVEAKSDGGDVEVHGVADVRVTTSSGDVAVSDVSRAARIEADSGDVKMSGGAAKLTLVTDSGGINASGLSGDEVTATADSGDIDLIFTRAPKTVKATTDAGDVMVRVPGDGSYAVDAKASSGEQDVKVRSDPSADSKITVRADAGDIRVKPS